MAVISRVPSTSTPQQEWRNYFSLRTDLNHVLVEMLRRKQFWSSTASSVLKELQQCKVSYLLLLQHTETSNSAKHLRSKDRAMNNHVYPRIHYPEVYILEGGYCAYYKHSANRCQPLGYVTMDDPSHALSRREDLDQFRKAKFGRTKSYAYGDLGSKVLSMTQQQQQQQPQSKRNTAPSASQLFAAANVARTRRNGLSTLTEIGNLTLTDDEETDIGDSPCPPPTKGASSKVKRLVRVPIGRAETFDASRMAAY